MKVKGSRDLLEAIIFRNQKKNNKKAEKQTDSAAGTLGPHSKIKSSLFCCP